MLNKHAADVDVQFLHIGLTNEEACALEKQLIKDYKAMGQCKTNFHEGGSGGNTGNYEQVSKSLSAYLSEHDRSLKWYESMQVAGLEKRGKAHSQETKMRMSLAAKQSWEDKSTESNQKRLRNLEKHRFKPGISAINRGVPLTELHYKKMMNADCPYLYKVYFNNQLIYWSISSQKMEIFCKETFNISRTIVYQLVAGTWKPKFNKHKHLESLKIIRLDRSVSTNRDECTDVEWKLLPFEVPSNLDYQG